MTRVKQSYEILDSLQLPSGLFRASPSSDYGFVWLRDSFFESYCYLLSSCDRYERTYHAIFDIFKDYEWKIDVHTKQKPAHVHEYIHPRYTLEGKEVDAEWGNVQHDAIGAILFGIGQGEKAGKRIIRDNKDKEIVQKLVEYLETCHYWNDPDNGIWEEWREVHSSSLGACVAGLKAVRDIVFVPDELIRKGTQSLAHLFPNESVDRPVDSAQLSLIYPYKVFTGLDAEYIVKRIEESLLRHNGCLRYQGDSYYSTIEHLGRGLSMSDYYGTEAEWTMFLPWLSLCHMELGNYDKAEIYLKQTERVMLDDGSLPELYFANSDKYNGNSPLGWSQSLFVIAKEKFLLGKNG